MRHNEKTDASGSGKERFLYRVIEFGFDAYRRAYLPRASDTTCGVLECLTQCREGMRSQSTAKSTAKVLPTDRRRTCQIDLLLHYPKRTKSAEMEERQSYRGLDSSDRKRLEYACKARALPTELIPRSVAVFTRPLRRYLALSFRCRPLVAANGVAKDFRWKALPP